MSNVALYELTQPMINPLRDRRRKHGVENMNHFAAGTRFAYVTTPGGVKFIRFVADDVDTANPRIIRPLLEMSKPVPPRTFADICAIVGTSTLHATVVIDRLIEKGALLPEQVSATLVEWLEG